MITFGVPSYNRSEYLRDLVESIYRCQLSKFEILIVEDYSPERNLIRKEVEHLVKKYSTNEKNIRYIENHENLGFDKNLKEIIRSAAGDTIVFIGNDDIVDPIEMTKYIRQIEENDNVSVFLRGYKTFDSDIREITKTKIVNKSRIAKKLKDINIVYRFSGIISGYAVNKSFANMVETSNFDGGLFYQVYLSFSAYDISNVFLSSAIPVLCRRDISPDFGSSTNEKHFTSGNYTVKARIFMAKAHLDIGNHFKTKYNKDFLKKYKKAMSQNITPHLITLQNNKLKNMTKVYLYLLRNGIGWNMRSIAIYFVLIIFDKTTAAILLNRISNIMRLSRG